MNGKGEAISEWSSYLLSTPKISRNKLVKMVAFGDGQSTDLQFLSASSSGTSRDTDIFCGGRHLSVLFLAGPGLTAAAVAD